jgi:hypothetical protein
LGAEPSEKGTHFVLTANTDWEGQLIFDPIRHKSILNLPVDYPRINQFPEWFTVDPKKEYKITVSDLKLSNSYSGAVLLKGIPLKLSAGQTLILAIE